MCKQDFEASQTLDPFLETLILHGVIFEGEVIISEPAKTLALGAAWQPTFDAQKFDEQAATQYLQELGNIGEYSDNSMAPDLFSYRRAVRNKPNSFPGPDFLPYAAWAASGSTGVQCLLNCDHHLREGNEAPQFSNFNACTMAFLVKGEAETDSVAVIRSPKDTRPLCMTNTLNELIVDANCKSLNSEFSQITHHTQHGFTGGRNFLKKTCSY